MIKYRKISPSKVPSSRGWGHHLQAWPVPIAISIQIILFQLGWTNPGPVLILLQFLFYFYFLKVIALDSYPPKTDLRMVRIRIKLKKTAYHASPGDAIFLFFLSKTHFLTFVVWFFLLFFFLLTFGYLKMSIEHITRHSLQGKILLQIQVSMAADTLVGWSVTLWFWGSSLL